jgi:hypothetical protein
VLVRAVELVADGSLWPPKRNKIGALAGRPSATRSAPWPRKRNKIQFGAGAPAAGIPSYCR